MKGNRKLLVIAALLLFVGVGFATYAIYKTTATGTATVSAANWSVAFKANNTTISDNTTINLSNLTWTNTLGTVKEGKIAPGSSATFDVEIDATGSEVDVDYEVTVSSVKYNDGTTDVDAPTGLFTISAADSTGTILYSTTNSMKKVITVTITWAGNVNDDATKISSDLTLNGKPLKITIGVTAAQRLASVNH